MGGCGLDRDRVRRCALLCGAWLMLAVSHGRAASTLPPVRVGSEVDYPPFCIVDAQGRADGFSVELMRHALAAMGREVEFRTGVWEDVIAWPGQAVVEALPLVGRTPEREPLFDFTFPYMTLFGAIVVRTDTTGIERIEDLRGRRVAVMRGDNAEEFLRREDRGIEIRTTATFEQALRELSEGRHDAVVIQRMVAYRLLSEIGLDTLRVVPRPVDDFRQDFCFAVKKGDAELLALLNEGLSLVIADGTYRRLHAKWFAHSELPSDRRLIIGGDHAYPPFEYLDEQGQPAGLVVDMTRAIARAMGLEIEIRLGPWAQTVRALERGEIDAIQGMFYSTERDRAFDFSPPYLTAHYVSVVGADARRAPADLAGLEGLRVAVQEGDVMHGHLLEQGFEGDILLADSQEEALRAVVEGTADCALVMRFSALELLDRHGWSEQVRVGRAPFLSLDYSYAVRAGERAILALFTEGLRVLQQSGEYRRIQERWLGVIEEPLRWKDVARVAVWVLAPLLLILLAALLWTRLLHRQVAARTRELQESQAFNRAVLDNLPAGIAVNSVRPDVRFLYMNDSFPAIYHTTRDALAEPDSFWNVVYEEPGFRESIRKRVLADCAAGDPDRMSWDDVPIARGGEVVAYISARNVPVPESDMMIAMVWDVTDRKRDRDRIEHLNRALKAVRDVNQLIVREHDGAMLIREGCRLMVHHRGYVSALIVLLDEQGNTREWAAAGLAEESESFRAMLDRGEMPPCLRQMEGDHAVVPIHDRPSYCAACPLVSSCRRVVTFCMRLAHAGATYGYLAVALDARVVTDEEERGLMEEMADDLSYALHNIAVEEERRESERQRAALGEQLVQAQKMESVGRLAGGVAHDFNNLLMTIMGNIELCLDRVAPEDPMRGFLDDVMKSAERSADLTRQLLAFARKQTISPRVLDLNDTLSGILKLLGRLLGEHIDLVWQPGHDLWPVRMDPSQLDQVLANLSVNARDAIEGSGRLTITTGKATLDEAACAGYADASPGDYVVLSVSDSGKGMDRKVLEHLFEPFYTTKAQGEGTGLGLATVYGIVKQNGGFIHVYSEPGCGTRFRIYLPRADEAMAEDGVEAGPPGVPTGTETILLVEDEPAIRAVIVRLLTGLGYRVLSAADAGEALIAAEADGAGIELLLTDVVMPGLSGRDLADRLREGRPNLRVLFMSGYTADVIAHHGVLDDGIELLQKPITRVELANSVRRVLDA